MRQNDIWFWQPGAYARIGIVLSALILVASIGYLHTLTGLAYEFHVLFIAPVLLVAWWVSERAAYGIALFSIAIWFVADRMLGGEQADYIPLLLNSILRLTIFLGSARLVSQILRLLRRESRLSREDSLTQLPNRREFHERGQRALAQAQRQSAPFTVIFIDLDRFKEVNDSLGHEAGDQVLATVARIMLRHVRESDIPGRLGGDEFALLLPNMDADAASRYIQNLQQRLLTAMRDQHWPVTFSIGVASYRQAPRDFNAALALADSLMYEVKNSSRDRILLRGWEGEPP